MFILKVYLLKNLSFAKVSICLSLLAIADCVRLYLSSRSMNNIPPADTLSKLPSEFHLIHSSIYAKPLNVCNFYLPGFSSSSKEVFIQSACNFLPHLFTSAFAIVPLLVLPYPMSLVICISLRI